MNRTIYVEDMNEALMALNHRRNCWLDRESTATGADWQEAHARVRRIERAIRALRDLRAEAI